MYQELSYGLIVVGILMIIWGTWTAVTALKTKQDKMYNPQVQDIHAVETSTPGERSFEPDGTQLGLARQTTRAAVFQSTIPSTLRATTQDPPKQF